MHAGAGGGGDDDHDNGSSTLPPSPSSPPQQHMLAPPDFPPTAAATASTSTSSASAAGPPTRVFFPGRSADGNASFETISNSRPSGGGGAAVFHPGFDRPSSYHYHHHRHHHHHQHLHFAASRQFGGGGGGGGGPCGGGAHGGGPHGEDDFEFLRTILLDAGSGTSQAAHNSALPSLGAAGYIPVSAAAAAAHAAVAATDAPFAPMSAAKSSLFNAVSSSPLGAHHPSPPSPSYVGGGGGGGGSDSGSLSFGVAVSGGSGRYGGNQAVEGPGGYHANGAGGYHVTEEERLQAADDVARCIWLAGDELREILLERLFDLWSTVEAEMVSYADGAVAAAGTGGGGGSAPRKSFNEVLVERLQATCQAVEAELKAAKARGDDTAFCNPPQHHWRGSGALRGDVLSRLEAYRRENQGNCGMPGSGHGRFSSLNCIDDFERANALARGDGGGGGRHRGGNAGGGLAEDGAGDLRQGLDTAMEATRGAVKSELLMFGDGEPAKRNAVAHPVRPSPKAGGADRRSAAATAAAAAVAAAAVAPTARGGAPAERNPSKRPSGAADKNGNKKRKRSGNGRRCKHEGW